MEESSDLNQHLCLWNGGKKLKSESMEDFISELPAELKENILERLPFPDAARTAVLSSRWNDAWLQLGRVEFDDDFLQCFSKYEEGSEKGMAQISAINDILMLRAGSVKKFSLHVLRGSHPRPQQSDLDRWCRFLSREKNGLQQLFLCITPELKLPSCIFSCPTIKRLILGYFIFDFPIPSPACSIFRSLTALFFQYVEFSDNIKGIRYTIPNLEELGFSSCEGVTNFQISSPKLERYTYTVFCPRFNRGELDETRCFTGHLKTIKNLRLYAEVFPCKNAEIARLTFPTAINLKVIELDELDVSCLGQLASVVQLLQNSPILCELKIISSINPHNLCCCDITTGTRLMREDSNSCIIKQDLKNLETILIQGFNGVTLITLFVKMLLSKSPTLKRVIIDYIVSSDPFEDVNSGLRELLLFPRASPEAQIVFREY